MLKTLGVHFIRHPCLTRTVRVRPRHQKSRAMPVCDNGSVSGFVKMRSLGSARPCADSGRPLSCILARRACSVGFASCLVNRLGCHIVWQLSAADFKHPCLKLWASTITHPCVCGRLGRRVLAPTLGDRYRASFARL